MTTTAEGVELLDQVAQLREAGCTQIQGYVFSRPRRAAPRGEIAGIFALRLDGYGDEGATRQIGVRALAG